MPLWLASVSPGEKTIYEVAKARFEEIIQALGSAFSDIPLRQRKLVRTQIAKRAGFNEKYIHKTKTPELYAWIATANEILEAKALENNAKTSHLKQTGKLKRDNLLERIRELELYSKSFQRESISILCRQLIDSELVSSHADMVAQISQLKVELIQASEREASAEARAQKWHCAYIALEQKYLQSLNDLTQQRKAALIPNKRPS